MELKGYSRYCNKLCPLSSHDASAMAVALAWWVSTLRKKTEIHKTKQRFSKRLKWLGLPGYQECTISIKHLYNIIRQSGESLVKDFTATHATQAEQVLALLRCANCVKFYAVNKYPYPSLLHFWTLRYWCRNVPTLRTHLNSAEVSLCRTVPGQKYQVNIRPMYTAFQLNWRQNSNIHK